MSDTVKFQITMTKTYKVNLNDLYRDYQTLDLAEALAIDLNNISADPSAYMELDSEDVEVTGKVFRDGKVIHD